MGKEEGEKRAGVDLHKLTRADRSAFRDFVIWLLNTAIIQT